MASASDLAPTLAPIDGALHALIETIWGHEPPCVGLVQGRWRWRSDAEGRIAVRELLARKLGPGSLPFDPDRAHRLCLPPTTPSSRPCEVAFYPTVIVSPAAGPGGPIAAPPVYLCLFYSMRVPQDASVPDRERAYYRVVETLDRFHAELQGQHPGRTVRAIDLPMPGWMGAELYGSHENCCPLVSS